MGKIVCIGGGELKPYETKEIDEEIVRLAGKNNPKLLFIGTASRDNNEYFEEIKKIFNKLGCLVSNLDILNNNFSKDELENKVLTSDIIYVGGGNTAFMLEEWRKQGLDLILKEAYEKNIVLSGLSAGSYCWFKYNYSSIEGIGLIDAINCAHYNLKDEEAKNKFYKLINEKKLVGYAIDNCVAIKFIDGEIKVIKSNANMNAYKIENIDGNMMTKTMF